MPVLNSATERDVLGYVTEAYALKRYTQELERMRGAELGQRDLFSIGPRPKARRAFSVWVRRACSRAFTLRATLLPSCKNPRAGI